MHTQLQLPTPYPQAPVIHARDSWPGRPESAIEPITMSAPDIDERDVEAVLEVLRSGRLSLGPKIEEFEASMAHYVRVKHAVAVSSGTAALHLIVRALGIGPGDEVLVPSFTFAASVNAVLFEGATPVFVDIEPETYTLDPASLAARLTSRTRAVMVVDTFGHPALWDEIVMFASEHGLKVIDDSCEALGAAYKGRMVGGLGDAAAFAFYPNKQMTTGEGGLIATNDDSLADLARSMRNQGRDSDGSWLNHLRLGYNYRMNEMSAALGCSQLAKIEVLLNKREAVARLYDLYLCDYHGVRVPAVRDDVRMSWFVYVATLDAGVDRDAVIAQLAKEGIPSRCYFPALHLQPYLREAAHVPREGLPVTEQVCRRTIALPFHGHLAAYEVETVANSLARAIGELRA